MERVWERGTKRGTSRGEERGRRWMVSCEDQFMSGQGSAGQRNGGLWREGVSKGWLGREEREAGRQAVG
eukprot:761760-Hanusia_phi.AAC.1